MEQYRRKNGIANLHALFEVGLHIYPILINFKYPQIFFPSRNLKPIFHMATLFARREAKTRIRQHDWLKLAGEKIRREQVGSIPTFLSVRANKVAKWKIGLSRNVSKKSQRI